MLQNVSFSAADLSQTNHINDGINYSTGVVWPLRHIFPHNCVGMTVGILTCQSVQGQKQD